MNAGLKPPQCLQKRMRAMRAFLLVAFAFVHYIVAKEVELELIIPWPSGIYMDRVQDPNSGDIYRFGRLRLSTVDVRPPWQGIYVQENVLSVGDAQELVRKAEAHAKEHGWSQGRHIDYAIRPTKDLSMDTVLPADELQTLKDKLAETLFPRFKRQYGLRPSLLHIDDLFITKYESISKENSLAPHIDKNPWSFVVALNDDFSGGGTYFVRQQKVWNVPMGAAVIFHGYQMHGAYRITGGSRYILAGFCEYGNQTDAQFMTQYDPAYEGHAAAAGFHTGDLIVGLERCVFSPKTSDSNQNDHGHDHDHDHSNDARSLLESLADSGEASLNLPTEACTAGLQEEELVSREMVEVTGDMTDEEWTELAQSCERVAPDQPTRMRVRRFVPDEEVPVLAV